MADKLKELEEATKEALLDAMEQICLDSLDLADCIGTMKTEVDNFVDAYVENDEFFQSPPYPTVEKIKNDLEPIFEEAYVTSLQS